MQGLEPLTKLLCLPLWCTEVSQSKTILIQMHLKGRENVRVTDSPDVVLAQLMYGTG